MQGASTAWSVTGSAADPSVVNDYPFRQGTGDVASVVAAIRDRIHLLEIDSRGFHHALRTDRLSHGTAEKARASVASLLGELSVDRGLGWSDIASLVGVSVSAIRKWRTGADATADSREKLAQLAAFLDVLEYMCGVDDPARWMEIRLALPEGYRIRPVELYRQGHLMAILEIASGRQTPEQALDDVAEGWRDTRSDAEVVEGPDGELALRRRSM